MQLTDRSNGKRVYVNISKITAVREAETGCRIYFGVYDDRYVSVEETYDEVVEIIRSGVQIMHPDNIPMQALMKKRKQ